MSTQCPAACRSRRDLDFANTDLIPRPELHGLGKGGSPLAVSAKPDGGSLRQAFCSLPTGVASFK